MILYFLAPCSSSFLPSFDSLSLIDSESYSRPHLHSALSLSALSLSLSYHVNARKMPIGVDFWARLSKAMLVDLLQDPSPLLRGAACDCLAAVTAQAFNALPVDGSVR